MAFWFKRPARWLERPRGIIEIDYNHWMWSNIKAAVVFPQTFDQSTDLVGNALTKNGTATADHDGLLCNANDEWVRLGSLISGSSPRTVVAGFTWPTSIPASDAGIFSIDDGTLGSSGARWSFKIPTSGNLRIEIQGGGYTATLSGSGKVVAACRLNGSTLADHTLYLGSASENATGTNTINTSAAYNSYIANHASSTNNRYLNSPLEFLYFFSEAKSSEQIFDINGAPWQGFKRNIRRVYAIGGGTIHTATGSLASGASTAAGAAVRHGIGSGALASGAAAMAGASARDAIAAGAMSASAASMAGAAFRDLVASGALAAGVAAMVGGAIRESIASGALVSGAAVMDGVAEVGEFWFAAGSLVSNPASMAGASVRVVLATGDMVAGSAAMSGVAGRDAIASGDMAAGISQASGVAVRDVLVSGDLAAEDAAMLGTAVREILVSGSLISGAASMAGVGGPPVSVAAAIEIILPGRPREIVLAPRGRQH